MQNMCFSLLTGVMFFIGKFGFYTLYYFIPYRKKIVRNNLINAFPNYHLKEIKAIEKKFYHNFIEWTIEYILLYFMPRKRISTIIECDTSFFEKAKKQNENFYGLLGHQFNWEFVNLYLSSKSIYNPFCVFYLPAKNHFVDNFIYKTRSRFGSKMISAYHFAKEMMRLKNLQHSIGILADQRPFDGNKAYWCNFFYQKTPFMKEAEKSSIIFKAKVYFVKIKKIKRLKYQLLFEEINFNPNKEGDLTLQYVKKLENAIKENPDNYLWSHKRWKFIFEPHKHFSID